MTQYDESDDDWAVEGFSRLFVPYGHTALAEADVSTTPATAAYNYLAHDHLGTGRYVYNQAKTRIAATEHLPYGTRYAQTGAAPYHEFTGKPWDTESGMFYFPYRYYMPDAGRWISSDPLSIADALNIYEYAGINPVTVSDPMGLFKIKGNCNGKEKEIERQVQNACNNLDNWITDPDLKKCVKKRCERGTIVCKKCKDCNCAGYSLPPLHRIWICTNNSQYDDELDDTAIHEWLHTCGYHAQDPDPNGNRDRCPYGDGI